MFARYLSLSARGGARGARGAGSMRIVRTFKTLSACHELFRPSYKGPFLVGVSNATGTPTISSRRSYSTTDYKYTSKAQNREENDNSDNYKKDDEVDIGDLYTWYMVSAIVIGSGIECCREIGEWRQTVDKQLYKLPFHIVRGGICGGCFGIAYGIIPPLGWYLLADSML